ncbi:MAG: hypothetical protein IPO77_22675 [Acidobacteria bacterium]|nr:hypothetical protein [Acidobacteriota bacterium]
MAEEIFGDWAMGEEQFTKDPVPRHPAMTADTAAIVNQPRQCADHPVQRAGTVDRYRCGGDLRRRQSLPFHSAPAQNPKFLARELVDTWADNGRGIHH